MLFWKICKPILCWIQNILTNGKKKLKEINTTVKNAVYFTLKINELHHWSWVLPKQLSTQNSIMQYEIIYMRKQKQKEALVLFSLNYIHKYLQPLSPLIQIMITIECSYMSRSSDLLLEFALLTRNLAHKLLPLFKGNTSHPAETLFSLQCAFVFSMF